MNQIVELNAAETAEVEGGIIFLWGAYAVADFLVSYAVTRAVLG